MDALTDGVGRDWAPPAGLTPQLASALGALTEQEREALMLVAWDELSATDAAAVPANVSHTARVIGVCRAIVVEYPVRLELPTPHRG